MTSISFNLKMLLKKEGISESELSRRVGIPQQMINRIITGINQNPKLSTITPIANYFKIPLQELIYSTNSDLGNITIPNSYIKIPYIEFKEIEEHDIDYAISNTTTYLTINLEPNKKYFATTMNDDSMEPKFSKDTVLIFEKEKEPSNGDFCLLKDENNHYIFRQILVNTTNKKFIKCLNPSLNEYTATALPVNIYVLATLLESRTSFL